MLESSVFGVGAGAGGGGGVGLVVSVLAESAVCVWAKEAVTNKAVENSNTIRFIIQLCEKQMYLACK